MNSSRHTNTALFVAVLSACLGLLIAGVPVQAQAQSVRGSVRFGDEVPAAIKSLLNHEAFVSPLVGFLARAQKLATVHNSFFELGVARERAEPAAILYQNSKPLIKSDRVLTVTHLPRAALSDSLAGRASGELKV